MKICIIYNWCIIWFHFHIWLFLTQQVIDLCNSLVSLCVHIQLSLSMCLRANADVFPAVIGSVKNNVCELEPWEWFIRFKLLWTNQISPCISEEVTHRNCAWSSGKFDLCLNRRVTFCKSFNWIWKVCCISGFVHFCILVCGYNSWEEHLFCCFSAD